MIRGKRAWWLLLAVAITWLDLWSKGLWDPYPPVGQERFERTVVADWLEIRTTQNPGGVWSTPVPAWILTAGTALAVPLLLLWIFWPARAPRVETFGKALILGGAAGNLYDRLRWSAVRDFIDVVIFGYDYPTFNVADIALVAGIALLLVWSFVHPRPKESAVAR